MQRPFAVQAGSVKLSVMGEATDPGDQTNGSDVALAFVREFLEGTRHLAETAASAIDGAVKYNERASLLYEKLVVLDGATIALSITFLGGLLSLSGGGHIVRHPSLWFVSAAWAFLLSSMYFCWHVIQRFLQVNRAVLQQGEATIGQANLLLLKALADMPPRVTQHQQIEMICSLSGDLAQMIRDVGVIQKKAVEDAAKASSKSKAFQSIAFLCTSTGLFLLCVFALKTIVDILG
ncbi:MAG TPA: hypothetical protein VG206_09275 [Terriglobia bacterium]|nr:hypothetical protein [Terriglobia bacterium]